jgi:ATP-dependent Lhr-like helicase
LPWPGARAEGDADARPQRAAGAVVVLHDGALLGWLAKSGESLVTFTAGAPEADNASLARSLAHALGELVDGGERRALLLRTIDGARSTSASSVLGAALAAEGFTRSAEGWLRRAAR